MLSRIVLMTVTVVSVLVAGVSLYVAEYFYHQSADSNADGLMTLSSIIVDREGAERKPRKALAYTRQLLILSLPNSLVTYQAMSDRGRHVVREYFDRSLHTDWMFSDPEGQQRRADYRDVSRCLHEHLSGDPCKSLEKKVFFTLSPEEPKSAPDSRT